MSAGRFRRWAHSLRLGLRSPYYSDHAEWRKRHDEGECDLCPPVTPTSPSEDS